MSEEMNNDATPETADTSAETPADTTAEAPAETPAEAPATPAAPAAEAPAEEAVTTADVAEALGATATAASTATAARTIVTKPASGGWFWGTGRRKAAVARVRIKAGKGEFKINKRDLTEFFSQERDHNDINNVLKTTNTLGAVDVAVNIHGGGYTGQSGAIILGLARALRNYDPSLDGVLREHDFLTRDPRKVERKKPGQPGARKRFQFSKR